jgi:hypothetical protein
MNKATNPICVHCSDVGLFQFIWRSFVRTGTLGSRNTAENRLRRESPRLKEPLGNVAPIPVVFTPAP